MHAQTKTVLHRDDAYRSEQVVLGVLLTWPDLLPTVRAQLPPDAFEDPAHRNLFEALCTIADAGNDAFTFAAIRRELDRHGPMFEEPEVWLPRLMACGSSPGVLHYDLAAVREAFERRTAMLALQQTMHELQHHHIDPAEAMQRPIAHYQKLAARTLRDASGGQAGLRFVPLNELEPASEREWVWPGYAACGSITVLWAAPKAGKSTLLRGLLRDLYRGGPLAPEGEPMTAPTLIVSEETPGHWSRQAAALDLPRELVHLCAQPFFTKPTLTQWEQAIAKIVRSVEELTPRLVIFDTLSNLWPVRDENSAAEVNAALMPLRAISATGAALILVHHDRKSGGSKGEGARGSSAIGGFPDALVQLKRYRDQPGDTRRRLSYIGRFEKAPAEVIIDLTEDGYRTLGESRAVQGEDVMEKIASVLPEEGEGLTVAEVRERVDGIGVNRLRMLLHSGAEQGLWFESGNGSRYEPHKYALARADPGDPAHNLLEI
jgi:hypothetical protein